MSQELARVDDLHHPTMDTYVPAYTYTHTRTQNIVVY